MAKGDSEETSILAGKTESYELPLAATEIDVQAEEMTRGDGSTKLKEEERPKFTVQSVGDAGCKIVLSEPAPEGGFRVKYKAR